MPHINTCDFCGYVTTNKSTYRKHLKSKKHFKNEQEKHSLNEQELYNYHNKAFNLFFNDITVKPPFNPSEVFPFPFPCHVNVEIASQTDIKHPSPQRAFPFPCRVNVELPSREHINDALENWYAKDSNEPPKFTFPIRVNVEKPKRY